MLSGSEWAARYESRRRADGYRKVHLWVPAARAGEIAGIAARLRRDHEAARQRRSLRDRLRRLEPILRDYGIVHLALTGAAARGELKPRESTDLVADFTPGCFLYASERETLERDLSARLGRPATLTDGMLLSPPERRRLAAGQVRVF